MARTFITDLKALQKLKGNEFFRHVATLTAGTFLAQVINLALTPILSRLYLPEDYASFALFTSIVTQIAVVATLRLEVAIPGIQIDDEANDLARLALRISIIASILSFVGIGGYLFLKESISTYGILLLAPLAILLSAGNQVLNFYSTRLKSYRVNSLSRIILTLGTGVVSILFGWLGWGKEGLVLGFTTGLLLGTASLLYWQYRHIMKSGSKTKPDFYYLNRFRQFIFINTPHAFLDTLEISGVLLLMNRFYSATDVGSYFFAFRVLLLPVTLIGASVFQVFYQKMAADKNVGKPVSPVIRSVYMRMAGVGFPIFMLLFFFSEDIFCLVFGANWVLSGQLASILCPWLFLNFIASSVSSVSLIYNRQGSAIAIAGLSMSIRLSALYFLGDSLEFPAMLKTLTLISSIAMIFAIWWYHHVPYRYESKPSQDA